MTGRDRQRLLIIEDDPEIQHILSVTLADPDRELVSAETAGRAREVLADGDIDLVILDLILPDADGRSLLAELRAGRATASVPVVVITARTAPEIRHECYALGADAFVEKPFDPEALAADVAVRLERHATAERAVLDDPLTGLLNRAGLEEACADTEGEYGLALIHLDAFGTRVEHWGWDRTERVMKDVAAALRAEIPEEIELGRLGGDDFVLLAPGADLAVMRVLADEVLEIVRSVRPSELEDEGEGLTATVGVLTARPEDPLEESLEVAGQRIFQARAAEGDRVVAEDVLAAAGAGHVLVAEDDEISAAILLHRLEKEGLDVRRFDNGQDAYDDVLREMPALVILDVKMPGLDGFEVLDRLRKDDRFSSLPVIMLTSMGQEADVVRGFRLGADDYVLKPFSPTELSARVRRLLTRGASASSL